MRFRHGTVVLCLFWRVIFRDEKTKEKSDENNYFSGYDDNIDIYSHRKQVAEIGSVYDTVSYCRL